MCLFVLFLFFGKLEMFFFFFFFFFSGQCQTQSKASFFVENSNRIRPRFWLEIFNKLLTSSSTG